MPAAMHCSLLLTGLVCLAGAAAAAGTTVTFSPLDYKTCEDTSAMSFEVEDPKGTGIIRDAETGRCLTVKVCTQAYTDPGGPQSCTNACTHGNGDVVVLEDCGKKDTCDGATSSWQVRSRYTHPDHPPRLSPVCILASVPDHCLASLLPRLSPSQAPPILSNS